MLDIRFNVEVIALASGLYMGKATSKLKE